MNEAREVVLVFSVAWGAWAAIALWAMNRPPRRRVRHTKPVRVPASADGWPRGWAVP